MNTEAEYYFIWFSSNLRQPLSDHLKYFNIPICLSFRNKIGLRRMPLLSAVGISTGKILTVIAIHVLLNKYRLNTTKHASMKCQRTWEAIAVQKSFGRTRDGTSGDLSQQVLYYVHMFNSCDCIKRQSRRPSDIFVYV